MKKSKRIKLFILITIVTIALLLSLNTNRNLTKLEKSLKEKLYIPIKNISNLVYAKEYDQTESYLIQKNINASLENEIQELKELLELNKTKSSFKKENATVISRNNEYWLNTIVIDKGKDNKIKKGMAVITKDGLIGKISNVTKTTSEVKLITTSDIKYKTSVTIRVNNKDYYAILNGYDSNKHLLKVVAVDKSIDIKKGDIVLTSGLGNIPQGIYIGTIDSYEMDNYELSKIVYIKAKQDFNNINYVTVLKELND